MHPSVNDTLFSGVVNNDSIVGFHLSVISTREYIGNIANYDGGIAIYVGLPYGNIALRSTINFGDTTLGLGTLMITPPIALTYSYNKTTGMIYIIGSWTNVGSASISITNITGFAGTNGAEGAIRFYNYNY
jgi:hypothetical protein